MTTPREYTAEEVRAKLLRHVWALIDYWDEGKPNKRAAMEGLAFSILSTLDGSAMDLPGFAVIPAPHPEDKEYRLEQGENYYRDFDPEGHCDIAGGLHEHFHQARR